MDEKTAIAVLMSYAACQIVGGCDLCPLYKEEQDRTTQRGKCQEFATPDRLREALTVLRGYSIE